jgi:two-component system response regulator HydG
MITILLIEDDPAFTKIIENFLTRKNYAVHAVPNLKEATAFISKSTPDLVLLDYHLPDGTGFDFIKEMTETGLKIPVVVMTGFSDIRTAVKAIHMGARNYITKPVNPEELLMVISEALEEKELSKQQEQKIQPVFVKGESEASQELMHHIELIAPTNMTVLILGESGTGKENIARSIHRLSSRADGPFVAIDCGALSEELASSELFGHIKGSFTGAIADKKGEFEMASGGTIFLDEVGNLTYPVQVKLLRAIQERIIQPIGGNKPIKVDVRIITATNDDLISSVRNGSFREDLYHRVNEFSIRVPALRNRGNDMELFIQNFIEQSNKELSKSIKGLSPEVLTIFKSYKWPGNLRELKNTIKRSVLLTTGDVIGIDNIPVEMRQTDVSPFKQETELRAMNEANEKELIIKTLKEAKYNKSKAAGLLNIDRKTLYLKIARYGIEA